MGETTTKYFVFPKGKPEEKFEVLPHTAGDQNSDGASDFGFVSANLAGTDAWMKPEVKYVFDNANNDGSFVQNDVEQLDQTGEFDIMKEEVEVETPAESTEEASEEGASEAAEDEAAA